MTRHVLLATLGMSPVIVTAARRALLAQDIPIERIDLVYPAEEDENDQYGRWIKEGAELVQNHLNGQCEVRFCPLSMPDTNTRERSIDFLRNLCALLESSQYAQEKVHLLLAGGRKNMSALSIIAAEFFTCVQGVYHLLDRREATSERSAFLSIEELYQLPTEAARRTILEPELQHLNLFKIPFAHIQQATMLRQWLSQPERDDRPVVNLDAGAEAFYKQIFGQRISDRLHLRLTETAFRQMQELAQKDSTRYRNFRDKLLTMRDPNAIRGRVHGSFGGQGRTFHFYKELRTAERPFFYTSPDPIHTGPNAHVDQVVVVGLSIERERTYDINAETWIAKDDFKPLYTFHDLPSSESVLIAPLGLSPMIVTQSVVLLEEREKLRIKRIAIIYPQANGTIINGLRLLDEVCRQKGIEIAKYPIENLVDVSSNNDCVKFAEGLGQAIAQERERTPDQSLPLLISGGRKAMAAMAILAAQHLGLERVYHTTIRAHTDEIMIERETGLNVLRGDSLQGRNRKLFLECYDHNIFDLFSIPLITVSN
jgi:hypothetical protein